MRKAILANCEVLAVAAIAALVLPPGGAPVQSQNLIEAMKDAR